jgi:Tfp pilus assembly protein PilF
VTFHKDVAPIVFANCASCHRPGGAAPFSLLTYADVVDHADDIVEQTTSGHMPPWLPAPGAFSFVGDRRLDAAEIATLAKWAQSGKQEGGPERPTPPVFADGWESGTPDVVLTVPKPFVVEPNGEDIYRQLIVSTSGVPALAAGGYVRALEFKTNGAPIHHAVIRVDRTSASRRKDGEDGKPGFDGMGWNVLDPDGQFIGWAPGRGPIVSADGMQWQLDAGTDLVIEVHLIPGTAAVSVQPTIGLFLTKTPPTHRPVTVKLGSKLIDIPAGEPNYVVTDTYVLPVEGELHSVYPHAHYLAEEMRLTATMPDGARKELLHIPHWSFHWQQDYRYLSPITLPAGTRLDLRYTYNNSSKNAHNPSTPPVRVRTGPKSTDEMAEMTLQLLTRTPADAARLADEGVQRDLRATIAQAESRVRENAADAGFQGVLGEAYVEAQRFADAAQHLEAAIRLGDRSAANYNALGLAYGGLGRFTDALAQFQRAAAAAPRDEVMPFNIGRIYAELSQPAKAIDAYKRSLALNPDFPDARVNLAVLLFSLGRRAEALEHYALAVKASPNSAVILNNYGSALAASGRFPEAMQMVRRALAADPGFQPAQQNFSRLQAMGIR